MIEEIPFSGLSKMSLPSVGEPEEMSEKREEKHEEMFFKIFSFDHF